MKFHIINENGQKIASFNLKAHRDSILKYWSDRFAYAEFYPVDEE